MRAKLHFVLSISIFFSGFYGLGQQYWKPKLSQTKSLATSVSTTKSEFTLNPALFAKALDRAIGDQSVTLYFPDAAGKLTAYTVRETPVFHPELAKKYPQIKSYTGVNHKESCKVRFSVSPNKVKAMVMDYQHGKTSFVEPIKDIQNQYSVYEANQRSQDTRFECGTKDALFSGRFQSNRNLVDDQQLRTFRIAVSTTGEYTDYHGGRVSDALAAINATLTRVNEVFETDLGVRLELVPSNDLVIFTNAATDPYGISLNAQVQNTLTSVIGEANYDVGHLFHSDNDSGNSGFIGSVCVDNRKGSAFSAALEPEGDLFDLDYVAHELGHQFGANHTWSFELEDTGVNQVEPASGTTIMGYAGIVLGNNVAANSDDYFHHNSIAQISNYLETISCAQTTILANNAPVIVPQGDYIIPKGTPFSLATEAADPQGDMLSYTWEQIDKGVVTTTTFGPNNVSGANFRSLPPSSNPIRYFPRLSRIIAGELEQENPEENDAWETISNVERTMNFAVTVRDNNSEGGQVASDSVQIRVVNVAGPFRVSSQNAGEVYVGGSIQEITWEVANTDRAPVNVERVDILLSLNGGETFPLVLAENLINSGTAEVQFPGQATSEARIMIRARDNVFFAVNTTPFTIQASSVVLNLEEATYSTCKPNDIVIPFVYETYGGFMETMSLTANAPQGISANFSQTSVIAGGTSIDLVLGNLSAVDAGVYPVEITASDGNVSYAVTFEVNVFENSFEPVALSFPEDVGIGISLRPVFRWIDQTNSSGYDIQIATDSAFLDIVESASVFSNRYQSFGLDAESSYFWRVRPENDCGIGVFGAPFRFTTSVVNCSVFETDGQPLVISAEGTPTVQSKFFFSQDFTIADVNVHLELSHTYLEDLVVSLISPSGTRVTLVSKSCGNRENLLAIFDDQGVPISCNENPAISGTVQPMGSLAAFNGEPTFGEWTLEIEDTVPTDGGTLIAFSLELCVEGVFRPDEDGDGVFDDGDDLCPGTPKGVSVDTSGCPLNGFPADNFRISVESEACRDSDNGRVTIEATDATITYTATLQGNGINVSGEFETTQDFQDLPAGTYSLCITGTNRTINYRESCFDVVIREPEPLTVLATLVESENQLQLRLFGGRSYTIEWNGIVSQTSEEELTLNMEAGLNRLKISTGLSCQGVYERAFSLSNDPIFYPNPVTSGLTVALNWPEEEVTIRLYGANGALVFNEVWPTATTDLQLNVSPLSSGIYYLVVESGERRYTEKIVKK